MPSLNWIGKEAVANHDKEVPFKLLKKVKTASVGDNSQNLIIHGDNLEALKALMPYYAGQVKCIYIDPPYNTGNESWVYNDKVNSPKIKQWLGKVVGRESEDLTRHDKWLCMMYPRLKLLRDLLADDGAIFISLDDNEVAALKFVMDEIFGENKFLAQIIVEANRRGQTYKQISKTHEYIICYTKSEDIQLNELSTGGENLNQKDEFGNYFARELRNRNPKFGRHNRPNLFYEIFVDPKQTDSDGNYKLIPTKTKGSVAIVPKNSTGKDSCWRWGRAKLNEAIAFGTRDVFATKTRNGDWRIFEKYRKETVKPKTLWTETEFISEQGTNLLRELDLGEKFQFPKPLKLIERILQIVTDKDSLVLDSFAGSGTTGHAVMDLNKEDDGNRKFILVELEDGIAKEIPAERVKRAIKKYDYKNGFEYCELDKPLFNEHGQIEETCDFKQFATYIYFTETQTNIDPKMIETNFIGELGDIEYYLIFKGKDKNDLDKSFLKKLKATKNKKVVYADRCLLDEDTMQKYGIVFKQIPYEVKVY